MEIREVQAGSITIQLPIVTLPGTNVNIIVFDSLGQTQMIKNIAQEGIKYFTKPEIIICPEAKAIPIAQELARLWEIDYFVLRKAQKMYMKKAKSINVQSITTCGMQLLWYDAKEIEQLRNKKAMIFDDVVSSGGTLQALLTFAEDNSISISSISTIFLEGDSPMVQAIKNNYNFEMLGYLPLLSNVE